MQTYHPFEVYISLAIIYFIMTYTVTFLAEMDRKEIINMDRLIEIDNVR